MGKETWSLPPLSYVSLVVKVISSTFHDFHQHLRHKVFSWETDIQAFSYETDIQAFSWETDIQAKPELLNVRQIQERGWKKQKTKQQNKN